jgi:hypothetical protein
MSKPRFMNALQNRGSIIGVPLLLVGVLALFGDASSLVISAIRRPPQWLQTAQESWLGLPVGVVLLYLGRCLIPLPRRAESSASIRGDVDGSKAVCGRKGLGVAFWTGLAVPVAYALSAGPADWLFVSVRLPEWSLFGFHYFYLPLKWLMLKSEIYQKFCVWYFLLWHDKSPPATPPILFPYGNTPEYLSGFAGSIFVAWFIWKLVRWINYRDMPRNPNAPAVAHDAEPTTR